MSNLNPPPEFWRNANHDLGDGTDIQQMRVENDLCKDVDQTNNLWSFDTFARALGVEDKKAPEDELAEWEAEEMLADMMDNAGKPLLGVCMIHLTCFQQ